MTTSLPLATALTSLVLPPGKPRRIALMTGKEEPKYHDAPAGHVFDPSDMLDHLAGRRTWAATLLDTGRMARAGCRDYDGDDGLGETLGLLALDQAKAAGLTAAAIILGGRAHVWVFYAKPAPSDDIAAQLRAVLPAGPGEIYPSGNNIRLPFGRHRIKDTRGELVLQDGRRFDLDQPDDLEHGIRALLALVRNSPPPVAPSAGRVRSGSDDNVQVDPALYEGCSEERGGLLWASGRLQRGVLASIARGERVTVLRDGAPDDSDSAQLAALVYGLMRAHRKGEKPGVGALPEDEIRNIALFLRPQLRPGVSLGKFKWQIEYELVRYRPEHYAPEPTTHLPSKPAPMPAHLPAAATRAPGRPVGDQVRGLEQCAALLQMGAEFTHRTLAEALGTSVKTIGNYLAELRDEYGLVTEKDRRARTLRVVSPPRLKENNAPAPILALPQRENNSVRLPDAAEALYAPRYFEARRKIIQREIMPDLRH